MKKFLKDQSVQEVADGNWKGKRRKSRDKQ